MSQEKTEKPTPKKRAEARRKGQVARTPELGAWAALLILGLALPSLFKHEMSSILGLWNACLNAVQDPTIPKAQHLMGQALWHCMLVIVTMSCIVLVIGVAGSLAQGGFFIARDKIKPDFKHLNLLQGAKKLFGPNTLWEGAKILLKSAIVALFGYAAIRSIMPLLGGFMEIQDVLGVLHDKAFGLLRNVAVAGLLMAGVDYAMQRRRTNKQLRMSKQDIKEEHKQAEGDPLIKSAIRSRQLAMARNRMLSAVKEADVVMVNPTHVAVALQYDRTHGAPRVIAKGQGLIAAKIRAAAELHQVPMVRDVPLARALHASCEVGQEIPPELFAAVAQVLAFVFTRRSQGRRGGEHTSPRAGELPEIARRNARGKALPGTVKTSDED